MREHRTFRNIEVREGESEGPNGRPVVELRAITPGVVDDYGSLWNPATFDQRVSNRMAADPHDTPTLCWGHDWTDPIGHGIGFRSSPDGPVVTFELDDFDAVPRAKQAHAQLLSKTLRDCSVGFSGTDRRDPTDEERSAHPGIKEVIESADLDEVSLVMRGAVPGAKVLSLRSANGDRREISEDYLLDLAAKVSEGKLTKEAAAIAVDLAASPRAMLTTGTPGGTMPGGTPDGMMPMGMPVVVDGENVGALTQSLCGVLDEAEDALANGDMAACGALLSAAGTVVDMLLQIYGLPEIHDRDDMSTEAAANDVMMNMGMMQ